MSDIGILDASAILAYLHKERGVEIVNQILDRGPCWASAVNVCEVLGKLYERGMSSPEAEAAINELELTIVEFDLQMARLAASYRIRTRSFGFSLGDRACLALAPRAIQTGFNPTIYTADQSWTKIKWPFKITLIRSRTSAK
jgi:ribonuclease VapC